MTTFKVISIFLSCFIILCYYTAESSNVCPKIVSRKEWGARSSGNVEYSIRPVEYVIIHHTVTPECTTKAKCIERVFNTQNYHMENLEYDDIGYNFLIGSDGNIYEGVGWHKIGAHTYGYNSKSIGIGFIGTFNDIYPNVAAVQAAQRLLECGVASGELEENYKLIGGRQVIQTSSPGLRLYKEIQRWPKWFAGLSLATSS